MALRDILLLGDQRLYRPSEDVTEAELHGLRDVVADLHDTMAAFQARHGWGRAIAAPQIGVRKRIVCMQVAEPLALFNPVLEPQGDARFRYWEDCMSFPELMVRMEAPLRSTLVWRDENWRRHRAVLEHDFAALLHHEVDHLDGVLATQRALDSQSFALRRARPPKDLALRGSMRWLD